MNVRRNKLDCKCSESVCESDHLCDDCDAFQDLMGQVVLSHPIIQSSFLHEDLTNKGSESQSLLMLTHLALELIEKVKNFNKTTYFPVYQSKMGRFFLNSVSFLIKNRPKDSKSLYSLIARLDTYLPYLTTEHLQSLMDNFLWVPLNTLVSFKKKEATLTQLGKFFIKIFNFLTAIMQSSNESTLSAGHVRHCCEVYMQLKHETESHMKDTYAKYQIGYSLSNLLECNDLCALLFHEGSYFHCFPSALECLLKLMINNFFLYRYV